MFCKRVLTPQAFHFPRLVANHITHFFTIVLLYLTLNCFTGNHCLFLAWSRIINFVFAAAPSSSKVTSVESGAYCPFCWPQKIRGWVAGCLQDPVRYVSIPSSLISLPYKSFITYAFTFISSFGVDLKEHRLWWSMAVFTYTRLFVLFALLLPLIPIALYDEFSSGWWVPLISCLFFRQVV